MSEISSKLERWLINGVVITIPLVVTLLALSIVLDVVLGFLSPVVDAVTGVLPNDPPEELVQLTTLLTLVGFFALIGFVAEYTPSERISQTVHGTMESIPGVGTVYTTVRRASDLLANDDTDQFQEVKLVEFPHKDAYMLGFLTADTPPTIEDSAGADEMSTVMVPLGPNPTTNGFIVHVPAENVYDVDLTVEEAIRSIATLGVDTDSVESDA